jgi:hypothetical protein
VPPRAIGLFDDVLATGAHYRASSGLLKAAFPGVCVIGFFIARRVPEAADFIFLPIQPMSGVLLIVRSRMGDSPLGARWDVELGPVHLSYREAVVSS